MVKPNKIIFALLISFFLLFSFYPTIFQLSQKDNLADKNREFVLEHNYYWPDYNLYLSKIRQGAELRITAHELYTSEPHSGSLIQEFYVILGLAGRFLGFDPSSAYLLGRIILAPLLLLVILKFIRYYFSVKSVQTRFVLARQARLYHKLPTSIVWQILAFLIVIASGSFPRIWFDQTGVIQISRYMEWWSNIDALQRLTFIPHILFGQVVSFFLLFQLAINSQQLTIKKLVSYILLGNLAGLVFPPSLITLNGVILLTLILKLGDGKREESPKAGSPLWVILGLLSGRTQKLLLLFVIFTTPSLLYLLLLTKQIPWSTLVELHRTRPMMIPLDQYILGTGPIIFLGFAGALLSIIKKEKRFRPLILWITVTLGMASFFSVVREQSPLRFTQTGLFIPLGILGAYFFQQIYSLINSKHLSFENLNLPVVSPPNPFRILIFVFRIFILFYLLTSLFMMKVSLDWQITWIRQLLTASIPLVPSPPQAMLPLKEWMDGIRWLRDNTNHNDVVLAEVTAGNYIPAYSGNFVYFGQANTVDYDRKQQEGGSFFSGRMSQRQAEIFFQQGRIKYIFYSVAEKEKSGGKELHVLYPSLKPVFSNSLVIIYSI